VTAVKINTWRKHSTGYVLFRQRLCSKTELLSGSSWKYILYEQRIFFR